MSAPDWLIGLTASTIFGLLAGKMARRRGRTDLWFLAGFFLLFIGLIVLEEASAIERLAARLRRVRP